MHGQCVHAGTAAARGVGSASSSSVLEAPRSSCCCVQKIETASRGCWLLAASHAAALQVNTLLAPTPLASHAFIYAVLFAGVLSSRPTARDIKIDGFSLGICGNELIQDCSIELTIGRRYGLIGQNGCGKTSFLEVRAFTRQMRCTVMHLGGVKQHTAWIYTAMLLKVCGSSSSSCALVKDTMLQDLCSAGSAYNWKHSSWR
jgi:hypothetical protein